MNINCRQHRKTMELLSLKLRLEREKLDSKQREEIRKRIRALEKELQMD